MESCIKKSRFSEKFQFKELKCADGGHSINRDFTVLTCYKASGRKQFLAVQVHLTCFKLFNFNCMSICELRILCPKKLLLWAGIMNE